MPPGLWRCRRPTAVRRAGGGRGSRGCEAHLARPAIAGDSAAGTRGSAGPSRSPAAAVGWMNSRPHWACFQRPTYARESSRGWGQLSKPASIRDGFHQGKPAILPPHALLSNGTPPLPHRHPTVTPPSPHRYPTVTPPSPQGITFRVTGDLVRAGWLAGRCGEEDSPWQCLFGSDRIHGNGLVACPGYKSVPLH
jgi:hypothetical protein